MPGAISGEHRGMTTTGTGLDAAPDLAGTVVAWRVWRVIRHGGELHLASAVMRTIWPAREPLVAECLASRPFRDWVRRRPHHPAPAPRCDCGIYATGFDRTYEYLGYSLPEAFVRIVGRVALWGTVVECERGFGASHAYPLPLYLPGLPAGPSSTPPALTAGLERYGVPLEPLGSVAPR
jgi:hypothetical protein